MIFVFLSPNESFVCDWIFGLAAIIIRQCLLWTKKTPYLVHCNRYQIEVNAILKIQSKRKHTDLSFCLRLNCLLCIDHKMTMPTVKRIFFRVVHCRYYQVEVDHRQYTGSESSDKHFGTIFCVRPGHVWQCLQWGYKLLVSCTAAIIIWRLVQNQKFSRIQKIQIHFFVSAWNPCLRLIILLLSDCDAVVHTLSERMFVSFTVSIIIWNWNCDNSSAGDSNFRFMLSSQNDFSCLQLKFLICVDYYIVKFSVS